jgi:hypothetical protein
MRRSASARQEAELARPFVDHLAGDGFPETLRGCTGT